MKQKLEFAGLKKGFFNLRVKEEKETVSSLSSKNEQEETEFKGNWTASYKLKDGSICVHTPQSTSMGGMMSGQGFSIQSKSYNGIPMSEEGLVLQTNSTQQEFIEALRKSGLYEGDD
jgi:hypothetical protein